jgi:tubulin--tyrosine ligase/tubulin polyglutamylase TTLL9
MLSNLGRSRVPRTNLISRLQKMQLSSQVSVVLPSAGVVILQRYIENPMLYHGRKFDFRVWVLIDHKLNYYFFKYPVFNSFREGYIRLSSQPFELDIGNKFVHLTNNAVQKYHENYG